MKKCYQCRTIKGQPHICVEAQQFREINKCCGIDCEMCFSVRGIASLIETHHEAVREPYLQAILNSRNVRLD